MGDRWSVLFDGFMPEIIGCLAVIVFLVVFYRIARKNIEVEIVEGAQEASEGLDCNGVYCDSGNGNSGNGVYTESEGYNGSKILKDWDEKSGSRH